MGNSKSLLQNNPQSNALSPPLKWAGGKRWQIPHLRKYWERENHRRLVEPFCGGLAVALGLQPERALLNDANPHLINFYEWLKRGLRISIEMCNDANLFYGHRDRFNQLLRARKDQTREAASLFYFLNRTGYNGLCRFNRSGEFNVPFGRYANINYRRRFAEYQPLLGIWEFSNTRLNQIQLPSEMISLPIRPTTCSSLNTRRTDSIGRNRSAPQNGSRNIAAPSYFQTRLRHES
jgi:DNA adenine methylase